MRKRKKRRFILLILIASVGLTNLYFNKIKFDSEVKKLSQFKRNDKLYQLSINSPDEMIFAINQKIDSLENEIAKTQKVVPYYKSSVDVYDRILKVINMFGESTKINLEKVESLQSDKFWEEKFRIEGEGNFRDVFSLIHLFENSPEIYTIKIKEIKQTYSTNVEGKVEDRVHFDLELYAYYTTLTDYDLDTLINRPANYRVAFISNYFNPLIKVDIPPNDEGLFEVEGSKLLAIMPDMVYLIDKNGNTITLSEGDPVYLGYLTKIDYENYSCEFLLNKGGILERVKLTIDNKEARK